MILNKYLKMEIPMPIRELKFSHHNLNFDFTEVKRMFDMHQENACRYIFSASSATLS